MATPLNKTKFTRKGNLKNCNVVRELASTDRKKRPLIVTLEMGDYITFHSKGTRTKFSMPLVNVYYIAIMADVEKRYTVRLAQYNERRKSGRRAVRPKKPRLVGISPEVLHALSMRVK